ncbi:MAG: hypothetical protein K8M05_38605, partial [Deltaproteobacteria bacterium]|nr:hypothetical protein [Kofleriaceae bacterium]
MSELAFNYKNRRFTPKSDAVSWLVERLRDGQRGQLDAVMNDEGAPLTAPIATTPRSAFRALVKNQPGRYRLTQLDGDMMPIEDAETAYVTVPPVESPRVIDDDGEAEPVVYDDGPAAHRATAPAPAYRNAAPAQSVPATITAPFGTWPALPIPTALSGTEYLLAEALR